MTFVAILGCFTCDVGNSHAQGQNNENIVNLPVKCSVRMALDSQKLFKTQTKIQKLFIIHRKITMNMHTHIRAVTSV